MKFCIRSGMCLVVNKTKQNQTHKHNSSFDGFSFLLFFHTVYVYAYYVRFLLFVYAIVIYKANSHIKIHVSRSLSHTCGDLQTHMWEVLLKWSVLMWIKVAPQFAMFVHDTRFYWHNIACAMLYVNRTKTDKRTVNFFFHLLNKT